jgi:hypothetical protein
MTEKPFTESDAQHATLTATLEIATETIARQHGIGLGDATFALLIVAIDAMVEVAPKNLLRAVSSRIAVRRAISAGDAKAKAKALALHKSACDDLYREGQR